MMNVLGNVASSIFSMIRGPVYSNNDYELVIRSSKDIEHLLSTEWRARGKGLHELLNDVQASRDPLPEDLVRHIRFLATIRNKLIHDVTFHHIPDRAKFINNYEDSKRRLEQILKARGKPPNACVIM